MAAYILRRCLYAVLILVGVNLLTFTLFFAVNSPDNIARLNIGGKRVTAEAIEQWKASHGYNKPLWFNARPKALARSPTRFFTIGRCGCLRSTSARLIVGAICGTRSEPEFW